MAVKKESQDVSTQDTGEVPALVTDLELSSGQGFENQTSEDYTLPWLNLLQKESPQLDKKDPAYIEGAQPGDYCNTVLRKTYSGEKGLTFVPCMTRHVYVEWIPRSNGGGFVALHELDSPVVAKAKGESKEFGKYKVGDNDLVETFYIYGMTYEGPVPGEPFVMSFTSTKIKQYKDQMAGMRILMMPTKDGKGKFNPPLYCNRVHIASVYTSNDKGKFYVPVMVPAINGNLHDSCLLPDRKPEDVNIYLQAKKFYESCTAGEVKVDYSQQEKAGGATESDGTSSKDAPF